MSGKEITTIKWHAYFNVINCEILQSCSNLCVFLDLINVNNHIIGNEPHGQ